MKIYLKKNPMKTKKDNKKQKKAIEKKKNGGKTCRDQLKNANHKVKNYEKN